MAKITQDMKDYLDAIGVETSLPDGRYRCKVMKGNGHPAAKTNEKTGLPELFFLGKVTQGEYEGRTQPVTLRWFVSPLDADGNPKDEKKIKSGQGFTRRQTVNSLIALYGDAAETGEMIRSRFEPEASAGAIKSAFESVAGEIPDYEFDVVLKTKKDASGTERQNVDIVPAQAKDEFSA